jgi:ribosomal protein S27AE
MKRTVRGGALYVDGIEAQCGRCVFIQRGAADLKKCPKCGTLVMANDEDRCMATSELHPLPRARWCGEFLPKDTEGGS